MRFPPPFLFAVAGAVVEKRLNRRGNTAVALATLGVALLAAGSQADEPELSILPFQSEGDLRFHVDVSSFRAPEGLADVEIYVSISNDQIRFKREDGASTWTGRIVLETELLEPAGEVAFASSSPLEPQAATELDAGDWGIVQALRESSELSPGRYRLRVKIRDEGATRSGIFNRIRNAKREGKVDAWIEIPALGGDRLVLSDVTLARAVRPAEPGSSFGRHGVDFVANPSRNFGLILPTVTTYLEVYGGEDFREGDTYLVHTSLRDAGGEILLEQLQRARPASASFVSTSALDLTTDVVPGSYYLSVEVGNERTGSTEERRRKIEVLWAAHTWGRDPDSVLEEMELIMTEKELRTLANLSTGAREAYLADFWYGLDPDPTEPGNPTEDLFRARIRVADARFRSTQQRGILTDRGRVFVRYGSPDDVNYQYDSSSYGVDRSQERVADPNERVSIANRPGTTFLDPGQSREGDVSGLVDQRGGSTIKSKALEIWSYDGHGAPLTERLARDATGNKGLKFIFADQMGNGEFQLIGSTGTSVF